MTSYNYRYWQLVLLIMSLCVLLASLYFQYIKDLQPCPLCLMQRLCVILEVIVCFIALFASRERMQRGMAGLQIIIALAGLYFAGRQLWLQALPHDQIPACLPGLEVLLQYFPWRDIFHALLWGAADCAEVSWQFLGLSMPAWAALYFIGMMSAAVFIYINTKAHRPLT
ncbi:Disulfide bond formation protein B (Disulfide oxidoreductase) [Legionella beliardensis]|uniref:Disulfide bond formation protein B n=1 Tax=Legionella beliardensis TaxID=91822 RepID=A0A378I3X7_9GAMM|nr:disulfide bond formation protein B [Legionella beliardensis]STX29879.1 Disulfide bond formation protein B (Disulfide oxidoreductase) [Legionella beliardensis]